MKKYLKYVIIALLLISAAIVFIQLRKSSNRPEWKIDSPSKGTIREIVTATGSLNPTVLVEVGTEVSGTIKTLYKDFNDKVRKGEVLARLDTEILAASVESAQAEVNKARVSRDEASMEYNNSETLFSRDMISSYELQKDKYSLDQAKLNLATALLRLQTAEKNLKNATITSPIDGVIVSREVSEGQTVAASMNSPTLFTIANNLDQMEITASVDEADIGKISVGLPVEFSVDAHAGQMFTGSVQQIRLKSETEQNVVSYSVIIDAANPDHKLLPGMTTNVTIITQSKENVIRIPETATRFTPSKEVWELFGLKWEDDLIPNAR
ncbi:MAG TPA: efflux RND transporter periplasmic adaptor subunit, partial [Candidatus Syntrophosphaera sp.]|nr:efflux RND transporter periplasmic adaptor subunit [Candidatus Cloacimonadota bacterium]HOR02658.1 efflux RND transporter periplasmic adaptor subunit [Candidatus Syntrophosphaera sp.]HPK82805.1 efflux RND transporter periplasmic adaptor subunit [Candidatus Syntrophosphaera sp.]HRQ68080.1 efflux RND transporter periplasmic adaptor subunit [Candidatus Syntrophosphaera sp.]HRT59475.1 efflux RND transporter periplasmic adaptor subunit [Candidatus Syntrophosphaera sp.]